MSKRKLAEVQRKAKAGRKLKCDHPMTRAEMAKCLTCYRRLKQRESRAKRKHKGKRAA